jgi:hypothetical protein
MRIISRLCDHSSRPLFFEPLEARQLLSASAGPTAPADVAAAPAIKLRHDGARRSSAPFTASQVNLGEASDGVVVADFTGDGRPDIAVAGVQHIYLVGNKGRGRFVRARLVTAGNSPIREADVNKDRNADLVFATGSTIQEADGSGAGSFAAPTAAVSDSSTLEQVADLNADRRPDIITETESGTEVWMAKRRVGAYALKQTIAHVASNDADYVGDFNGDGKPDILVVDPINGTFTVLIGAGDGSFTAGTPVSIAEGNAPAVVGDFNNDGHADIAIAGNTNDVFLGNGDGTFANGISFADPTADTVMTAGDFNGDRKLDLALVDELDGQVSILSGQGNGSFGAASNINVGAYPQQIVAADLNGDGKSDLITANGGSDFITILMAT